MNDLLKFHRPLTDTCFPLTHSMCEILISMITDSLIDDLTDQLSDIHFLVIDLPCPMLNPAGFV